MRDSIIYYYHPYICACDIGEKKENFLYIEQNNITKNIFNYDFEDDDWGIEQTKFYKEIILIFNKG